MKVMSDTLLPHRKAFHSLLPCFFSYFYGISILSQENVIVSYYLQHFCVHTQPWDLEVFIAHSQIPFASICM